LSSFGPAFSLVRSGRWWLPVARARASGRWRRRWAVAGQDAPGSDLLALEPSRAGRVVYFAGEDPDPILDCRIHAIGKYLSDRARSVIAGRMVVESLVGKSMNVDKHTLHQLVEKCSGARLIVLDTLSRMHRL